MSSNTPNLSLYKADPVTDGNDTFNIKKMLNDNWDKIDNKTKEIEDEIPTIPVKSVNNKTGEITLSAIDVGAETPTEAQKKADAAETNAKEYAESIIPNVPVESVNNKTGVIVLKAADITALDGKTLEQFKADTGSQLAENANKTEVQAAQSKADSAYTKAEQAFQAGVDRKNQTVEAINSKKNISASTSDNWDTLIQKVKDIPQGQGNAVEGNVLSGKTFTNDGGNLLSGTMSNRGAPTWTPKTNNIAIPNGYYSGGTILGDSDLIASNIRSGKNIFGVNGSLIEGKKWAHGTVNTMTTSSGNPSYQSITNLAFIPSIIILYFNSYTHCNSITLSTVNKLNNEWVYIISGTEYLAVVTKPTTNNFTIKAWFCDDYSTQKYSDINWIAFE